MAVPLYIRYEHMSYSYYHILYKKLSFIANEIEESPR